MKSVSVKIVGINKVNKYIVSEHLKSQIFKSVNWILTDFYLSHMGKFYWKFGYGENMLLYIDDN